MEAKRAYLSNNSTSIKNMFELLVEKSEEFWGLKITELEWEIKGPMEYLYGARDLLINVRIVHHVKDHKKLRYLEKLVRPSVSFFNKKLSSQTLLKWAFTGLEWNAGNWEGVSTILSKGTVSIKLDRFASVKSGMEVLAENHRVRSERMSIARAETVAFNRLVDSEFPDITYLDQCLKKVESIREELVRMKSQALSGHEAEFLKRRALIHQSEIYPTLETSGRIAG
jgi:ribosomal protein L29